MKFNIKVRFDENGRPVVMNAPERVRNLNEPSTSPKRRRATMARTIVKAFKQMNKDSNKRHEERIKLMRESLEVQKLQLEKMREMVVKLTEFYEKLDEKRFKPEPGSTVHEESN